MKKSIILFSLLIVACSKPSNHDKAIQAAQVYLKPAEGQNIQFGKLDSVIGYEDGHLLQIAQTQQQLLLKQDTLNNLKKYDSLLAVKKTKYYVINYLDKPSNSWHMLVMDTTFKIKSHQP